MTILIKLFSISLIFIHSFATIEAEELQADKINLAIRRSLDQMLRSTQDSTTRIPVIHQINDNTWQSEEMSFLNYDLLPHLLQESFDIYNIKDNYHVALKSCIGDEIFLGYIKFDLNDTITTPCKGRDRNDDCQILEIQFTNQNPNKTKATNRHWYIIFPFLLALLGLIYKLRNKTTVSNESKRLKTQNTLFIGQTKLDTSTHHLIYKDKIQKLTYREAKLLQYFIDHQGKILDRETLLQNVWGDEGIQVSRSLDVFVSRIRKYIQDDNSIEIATIHGVGYRLDLLV